jgi:hypothetical protein
LSINNYHVSTAAAAEFSISDIVERALALADLDIIQDDDDNDNDDANNNNISQQDSSQQRTQGDNNVNENTQVREQRQSAQIVTDDGGTGGDPGDCQIC